MSTRTTVVDDDDADNDAALNPLPSIRKHNRNYICTYI